MAEKQKLTRAGYEKLQSELDVLINETIEEVKKQLAEARAQGDLSENADYDAARNKQAEVEARIATIQEILSNSEIIEENKGRKSKSIALGSFVKIRRLTDDKVFEYKIVGPVESDPTNNLISNACPLGEALLGKVTGDIVEVKSKITYSVEVLDFKNN